jgi:hypothetical protein
MDEGTELVRKLGIKANSSVVAINANPEILTKIKKVLPSETKLLTKLPPRMEADVILIWLTATDDLLQTFQKLQGSIKQNGAIWSVIPKRRLVEKVSISFRQVQDSALKSNLVDNKIASFSDKEYGIRLVIRKEKRVS